MKFFKNGKTYETNNAELLFQTGKKDAFDWMTEFAYVENTLYMQAPDGLLFKIVSHYEKIGLFRKKLRRTNCFIFSEIPEDMFFSSLLRDTPDNAEQIIKKLKEKRAA